MAGARAEGSKDRAGGGVGRELGPVRGVAEGGRAVTSTAGRDP